jgi:aminoglycoside phosphotransferase (APT) family kinase protein
VIGHGDLGPWNIVARDEMPVAFIDWDNAGPVDATWDLAQGAWLNVQLHDDDIAETRELPDPATRGRQLRLFADSYGLGREGKQTFVDQIAEFAIHASREEALNAGVTSLSTRAIDDDGYPVLWAITWRARSASWILRHRRLLEDCLTL